MDLHFSPEILRARDILGGAALTWVSTEVFNHLKWRYTRHGDPVALPTPDWPQEFLAQAYPAESLVRRLQVANATRIVLVVGRKLQRRAFEPGKYSPRSVENVLRDAGIRPNMGAEALQYRTTKIDLTADYGPLRSADEFGDITASLTISVQVIDSCPERLLDWHVSHDKSVTLNEVRRAFETELENSVSLTMKLIPLLEFDEHKMEAIRKTQADLNQALKEHGLEARIVDFKLSSEQRREYQSVLNNSAFALRMKKLVLNETIETGKLNEAYATLDHDGHLKHREREMEIEELGRFDYQRYTRDRDHAQSVYKCEEQTAGASSPRGKMLETFRKLRETDKPFPISLAAGGGDKKMRSKDASVEPPDRSDRKRIGDDVSLVIESPVAGYLYLLNLGTSERLWRLFPNKYVEDNRIAPGEAVSVPGGKFTSRFMGPVGTEHFVAIVSPSRITSLERLPVNDTGLAALDPEFGVQQLETISSELSGLEGWSEATLAVEVG